MDEIALQNESQTEASIHRHPLNPIALAFGVIFTLLGLVFVFADIDADSVSAAWLWASLLGAIGLVLIAVGVRRHRASSSDESDRDGGVGTPVDRHVRGS